MSISNATIHNVRLDSHFTITSNATPEDPRLSWAAKGLLWYVLSRSHDWKIFTAQLAEIYQGKERGNGYDAIKRIVKELRNAGYVKYTKSKDSKGKWQHRYDVYPIPHSDFQKIYPEVVKPPVAEPPVVKPPILPRTDYNGGVNAHAREEKKKNSDEVLITRDKKGNLRESCLIATIKYLRENKYSDEIINEAIKLTEMAEEPISNALKYVESVCMRLQSQNSKKPKCNTKPKGQIWNKMKEFRQKLKTMDAPHSSRPSPNCNENIMAQDISAHPFLNLPPSLRTSLRS